MKAEANPRITLESLKASETVPFIGLHKTDFKLLVAPAFAVTVLGILMGYTLVGVAVGGLTLLASGIILYITPTYMTSKEYLLTLREFLKRPKQFTYTTDTHMDPDSYFERLEEDAQTTDLTNVKRYYSRGVIERDDGKLLAALRLEPQGMDFADGDDWAKATRTWEGFANNSLDFDCQFYITSREFPIQEYTETLEQRLEDDDINSLPMLRATLKNLIEERPKQLEEANLAPLSYYAIVSVDRSEIITNTTADTSALEKLSKIPVLGIPFSTFATLRENLDEMHTRTRMLRKLDERIGALESNLVREIDGYDSQRVSTAEWLLTLEDYWKSYTPDFDENNARMDAAPISSGEEVERVREQIEEFNEDSDSESDTTTPEEPDEDNSDEAPPEPEGDLERAVRDSDFKFNFERQTPPTTAESSATNEVTAPEKTTPDSLEDEQDDSDSEETDGDDGPDGIAGLVLDILLSGEDDNTESSEEDTTNNSSDEIDNDLVDLDASEESSSSADSDSDSTSSSRFSVPSVFSGSDDAETEEIDEEQTAPDPESPKERDVLDVELPEKEDLQRLPIAAEDIEEDFRSVVVEETEHRQVLFVESWPNNLRVGALRGFFTQSDLNVDISIQIRHRDREKALSKAERRVQSLETDAKAGLGGFDAQDTLEDAEEARIVRDHLDAGQEPFDVSMYVVVRADSERELNEQVRTVRDLFRDAPANMGLKTLSGNQVPGLQSAAPVATDVVDDNSEFNPNQLLLGQGLASLLSSFKQTTLLERGGIEFGEHAFNGTPIIKDPFNSETNYNWVVIGDSGSGKSYESKEMALRTMMAREDTKLIILDPLEGFFGLSKALDAEHITIGGERGLNPLEIRPPAEHSAGTEDLDPLSQKLKDAMSFFENFANQQGLSLNAARPILSAALKRAYERRGITHDVSTHHRDSPTIRDVLDVLKHMAENPREYEIRSSEEREAISDYATELLGYLRPFVEGAYKNLAKPSDFDLRGEDVVYLDLQQQEHTASGGGIMMQLMFSLVYERAKETPKNVIFLIDEARFLMRDAKNLEFLGQRVRHSRHYNTSIRFITQNVGDFFSHEEAQSIVNNTFINVFHQTEEIAQWANEFGLSDQEVRFVEGAETGENGYSEALVRINKTTYPIQFFTTDTEDAIVDFDPRTDSVADLPGDDDEVSALAKEIRGTLEEIHAKEATNLRENQDELDALYEDLPPTHKRYLSLLDEYEFYQALELIRTGNDPSEIIAAATNEKMSELFGEINQEELARRLAASEEQYNDAGENSEAETRSEPAASLDDD